MSTEVTHLGVPFIIAEVEVVEVYVAILIGHLHRRARWMGQIEFEWSTAVLCSSVLVRSKREATIRPKLVIVASIRRSTCNDRQHFKIDEEHKLRRIRSTFILANRSHCAIRQLKGCTLTRYAFGSRCTMRRCALS